MSERHIFIDCYAILTAAEEIGEEVLHIMRERCDLLYVTINSAFSDGSTALARRVSIRTRFASFVGATKLLRQRG